MNTAEEWMVIALLAVPLGVTAIVALLKSYHIHIHIMPNQKRKGNQNGDN